MNCALLCFTYCVRSFWVSSCECSGLFLPASCFSRAQATVANVVKAKQKSFLLYPPFSFLRERKGFYLRSVAFLCFGFASQLQSRPSPTLLHVRGGDTVLLYEQSVAGLLGQIWLNPNLVPSRCGSR